jgi:hypothetical protein
MNDSPANDRDARLEQLQAERDRHQRYATETAGDLAAILITRALGRDQLVPHLGLTPDNELVLREILTVVDELADARENDVILDPIRARATAALATIPDSPDELTNPTD